MYESHVPPYVGHWVIHAMTQAVETYFYWQSMQKDIHDDVEKCMVCQKVKYDQGKALGFFNLYPLLMHLGKVYPWILSLDYLNSYMNYYGLF